MQSFQMKKITKEGRREGRGEERKREGQREKRGIDKREKAGGGELFWVKDMQEFLELFL